ncbi:Cu2+-exporting ATPase [Caulobacter ginsengisoli]|uniref:Cu2+-exporting ATPase n=1 Tax=Caulobacter ginsengisoli TaxID=400775 RepID=A0ABU0IVD2_9CAUL|nr:heavy metal translocating P-type ATPase [Caulobacter ginsengisoli]MDQ0465965.1 Cu2+-exporting ATPase [Caulobacter ginsengisoli]
MALTYDAAAGLATQDRPGGRLELLVKGARCAACLGKIEREIAAVPGVEAARLNLTTGKLTVATGVRAPSLADLIERLEALGYPAAPYDPGEAAIAADREGRRLILALGVAAFGAGNAMMFSVPLWAGLFGQELGESTRTFMQWASGLIGAPCALYAGMPFFQSAWRSLRKGRANMDVPISIGVLLTLAISFFEAAIHGRDTYFDAAVSLLLLLLVGRYLDHRLRSRARGAAADLLALQSPLATLLGADGERRVPVGEIGVGDELLVRPGERLPVDGVVESGVSSFDNALLTGETAPQPVKAGDVAHAGALNLTGALRLRATAASADSAVAAIARLVEAGAQTRSRYVRLADKAAALYVPVVHSLAAATFIGGWILGLGPLEALLRAVAVLIITCPCALGLAVPAVQITASSRLFRQGVLVKSGAALERLAEIDHVVFDKTGVLTLGRPSLEGADPRDVALAAPLARASSHPLARALAAAGPDRPMAQDTVETAGQGIEGRIDGRRARLGRAEFAGVEGVASGETELWFALEDREPVRFTFRDSLRPDARQSLEALWARRITVEILSGDLPGPVAEAAGALGLKAWAAALTPAGKAAAVRQRQAGGRKVLMVGDGLNDAAALAGAHAAMAPGTALDASQNAADLVFSGESLGAVVLAIDVARAARRRALENFGFSALYNLVAGPMAMLGLVNPFVAALAMSGSSLIVTLNALRMNTAGGRK